MSQENNSSWILMCVLIATLLTYAGAQSSSLFLYGGVLDEETDTLMFPPLDRSQSSNHLVGDININLLSDPASNGLVKFFLEDVAAKSRNGSDIQRTSVGESPIWPRLAESIQIDDCSDAAIDIYPQFRRQFCVNHDTGEIRTTKYFVQNPPPSGRLYIFHLSYRLGAITFDNGLKKFSVRINSVCDNMDNIYRRMLGRCSRDGVRTLPFENIQSATEEGDSIMFLTSLVVDLTNAEGLNIKVPQRGDTITIYLTRRAHETNTIVKELGFTFVHPSTYTAVINPPMKMRVSDISIYGLFTYSGSQGSGESAVWNLPKSYVSVTFLPVVDFCSGREYCTSDVKGYLADAERYASRCVINNEFDFIGKYFYCDGNSAPILYKPRSIINWDKILANRHPSLLHSNYTIDDNPATLRFELLAVYSKYPKYTRKVNTTSHSSCETSLVNLTVPFAYFCMNTNTGSIYSTRALIDDVTADDVFTLTVRITDVVGFPPRSLVANITLFSRSLCTNATSSFLEGMRSACSTESYKARIVAVNYPSRTTGGTLPSPLRVRLNIRDSNQIRVFYIIGIRKRLATREGSPGGNGTILNFDVTSNDGLTTQARYFYSGYFSYFYPPLEHEVGDVYNISAFLFDSQTNQSTVYSLDTSQWGIELIKKHDYCSESEYCVDLFTSHAPEHLKKAPELERTCENKDTYGFKAKYGYCEDNMAPQVRKSERTINLDDIRAAPQPTLLFSNYTSDDNPLTLKYELLNVYSRYSKPRRQIDTTTHPSCGTTFLNAAVPSAYFCLNASTGTIYSTQALVNDVQPGDVFTLTVKIIDEVRFPPRLVIANITLYAYSACTNLTAMLRHLVNSTCSQESYDADIVAVNNGDDKVTKILPNSEQNIRLDIRGNVPTRTFYIFGIQRRLETESHLNRNGSYLSFKLITNDGSETEARYFYVGYFSAFRPPLKYEVGDLYTLKTFIFDEQTSQLVPHAVDIHQWRILLIKQYDYCSGAQHCINLYKSYEAEYLKNVAEIDRKCADGDTHGFKAKFGYCQDNDQPEVVQSHHIIEKNIAVRSSQVIPSDLSPMYVTDTNPLKYYLLNVTSTAYDVRQFQRASALILPEACSDGQTTPLGSFFCINNITGKIYSTSDLASAAFTATTVFTLTVNAIDDTRYPMRSRKLELTLTVKDECSPASSTYPNLGTCSDYKAFKAVKVVDNYLYFYTTTRIQRVLGVKFQISELSVTTGVPVKAEAIVTEPGGTSLTPTTSTPIALADKALQYFQSLPLYLPRMDQNNSVKVRLLKHPPGAEAIPLDISSVDPTKFELLTMVSYKCDAGCIEQYIEWTEQVRAASLRTGNDCDKDPGFYKVNFERCIDPQPSFHSDLPALPSIVKSSFNLTLSAVYNSPFRFRNTYWLKDETARINVSFAASGLEYGPGSNLPQFRVPDLHLLNVKLADQGSYRAVIEDEGRVFSSKKVSIELEDIAESQVYVNITNLPWNNELSDPSSNTYQDLRRRLKEEINNRIPRKLDRSINVTAFSGVYTVGANLDVVLSNVNNDTRLERCEDIRRAITNGPLETLTIANVHINTHDCCLMTTIGEEEFKGVYTFPTVLAGTVHNTKCFYGHSSDGEGSVIRRCEVGRDGTTWADVDLSHCHTKTASAQRKLLDLDVVVTEENVEEVARNASRVVEEDSVSNAQDIEVVTDILTAVVNSNTSSPEVARQVATNVLTIVGVVLQSNKSVLEESNRQTQTSARILEALDTIALSQEAGPAGEARTISTEHIALGVIEPVKDEPLVLFSPYSSDNKTKIGFQSGGGDIPIAKAVVTLPIEVVKLAAGQKIFSYVFESPNLFATNPRTDTNDTTNVQESIVQSYVMSVSIGTKKVANLSNPIELVFKIESIENKKGESSCKFWDTNLGEASTNMSGGWSTDGCESIPSQNNTMMCRCNHFTNFAIILDVSQSFKSSTALSIISYIGCGISIVGLALTIITNLAFPKIRKKVPAKILTNLAVSLLLTLVIFLAGADRVKPQIGCRIVAILLQYFLLATFFWMAVEGLNLYRNFVKVFSGGSTGKFLLKCYFFGWGVPLVITAATAGAQWQKMGPSGPDDGQFCVLQGTPFYFALLLPVCIILIGNCIVLILVLHGITSGSKVRNDSPSQMSRKFASARIALACASLLGITWLFGVLAVDAATEAMQWLFCIFNSLQGFFIFIFYTVRSAEARREWLICLGIRTRLQAGSQSQPRSTSSFATTSTTSPERKWSLFEYVSKRKRSRRQERESKKSQNTADIPVEEFHKSNAIRRK